MTQHEARIARITRAYTRHYSDNGDTKSYVEWIDTNGETGRTEGDAYGKNYMEPVGAHMQALFARAIREGVNPTSEVW